MHAKEEIFDSEGKIDPHKVDAVARMGGDYYCRAFGENIFMVPKPNEKIGIGFDKIPDHVKNSKVLTGNDLGRLGNIEKLPDPESVRIFKSNSDWLIASKNGDEAIHLLAQQYLREGRVEDAWKVLL
jgi:hypothetical protein